MAIKENVLPLAQSSGSGTYIRTLSSGGESQRASFDIVKGAITADMDDAIETEAEARESADTQLQTEIDGKVDKVTGKGLSTNDFTNDLKTKLDGIEAGAQVNVIETVKVNGTALVPDANRAVNVPAPTVDSALSTSSTNPVQNKVITGAVNDLKEETNDKPNWTVGSAEQLVSDESSQTDVTPYTFRRSGGGLIPFNFTREELSKVVGGTVGWNQKVENGDFDSTTYWYKGVGVDSWSASSNVLTANINGGSVLDPYKYGIWTNINGGLDETHKYLSVYGIKPSVATTFRLELGGGIKKGTATLSADVWSEVSFVNTPSTYNPQIYFYPYSAVVNVSAPEMTIQYRNVQLFDLTAMFGSTIADYIYSLETANAGAGVAWFRKLFPKPYYEYCQPRLESVKVSGHETVGFNAWDEEWESGDINIVNGAKRVNSNCIRSKNFIPVISGTTYYAKSTGYPNMTICFYDADQSWVSSAEGEGYIGANNATFTTPSWCRYIMIYANGTTYKNDICINISKTTGSPKNGDYVPHEKHTYPLDSTKTLRGLFKLDSSNNLYADGDIYLPSGEIARTYGEYTFTGSETWTWFASSQFWYMPLTGVNTISEKIKTSNGIVVKSNSQNQIRVYVSDNPSISESTNMNTVFSNGTAIVYLLITPTTETADPYTAVQICDSDGTEEFVDALVEAGTRDVAIPAGTETTYFEDMAGKLAELPPIPSAPSANGTYTLQAVVSSGAVTYQWTS